MKKIYALLAAAAVVATSASAFNKVDLGSLKPLDQIATPKPVEAMTPAAPATNHAPAKAYGNSLSGIYARYGVENYGSSTEYDQTAQVEINGTDVTLYCLYYNCPIKGTFDTATGDITIPNQVLYYDGEAMSYNGELIKLYCYEYVESADGYTGVSRNNFTLYYGPNGHQTTSGDIYYVGGWVSYGLEVFVISTDTYYPQSAFTGTYSNVIYPLEQAYPFSGGYFRYDASEWGDCGTAQLSDGFFADLAEVSSAYDVPLKKKYGSDTEFLLVNPYGASTPVASINDTPNAQGFLYLDIQNPECCMLRPFVNSGFQSSYWFGTGIDVMNFSYEGYLYYLAGYEIDDIIEEADDYDELDLLGSMDENYLVTIPKCYFSLGYDGASMECWQYTDGTLVDMTTKIQLPDLAAINTVIDDNSVAPASKKYFNLQGVEISEPAAGQVVIVKEGNTTSKILF